MNQFETWNPSTNEKLNIYKYMSDNDVQQKIQKLETSFDTWKKMSVEQRIICLETFKHNLRSSIPVLAEIITQTMGKPLVEAKLEIEKCVSQFDYYIEKGPALVLEQNFPAHYAQMQVRFLPMGIIFSVMPWNYPVWQFFRFAVGAWLAGNVILLKHSEITTEVGLFLENLVVKSLDPVLLQTVLLDPTQAEFVFAHKSIRAVTFTGSSRVGRRIGELSGRYLKKAVLELGGNDAFVVDESADIVNAAKVAVAARLVNNGQSCIASKRFFIPKRNVHTFMNLVNEEIKNYTIGHPTDKKVKLGPLAHKKFFIEYHEHIQFLKKVAAHVTDKMSIPDSSGYFVSPFFFLIEDSMFQKESNVYHFFQTQEVFSPVGMVLAYENEQDWPALVNESPYGLGAVWMGDREKFNKQQLHLKFNVGMLAVNDVLKSDPRVPFGGVKDSGFGRESGEFGIREFCNIQSLGIK
ncbi:MAG: aldehyde dehydrogenase family protein [Bdellovibrionaceae bacterium]|nr:aldehyde dehydrogenase family protein [Pseudobdellovibrionaceae bacterium]